MQTRRRFASIVAPALIAGVAVPALLLAQPDAPKTPPAAPAAPAKPAAEAPKAPATPAAPAKPAAETPKAPAVAAAPIVRMSTSMGDIIIELDAQKAPISVVNFTKYVEAGFYNGTVFHRVIPGFMIQGGGFTADLAQKPTNAPIKNEWQNGLKNARGTIAMARTSVADSATSQFFINVADNGMLDVPRDGAAYAVFGRVLQGMEVADKIVAAPRGFRNGMGDVPNDTITIKSVAILSDADAAPFRKGGQPGDAKPKN